MGRADKVVRRRGEISGIRDEEGEGYLNSEDIKEKKQLAAAGENTLRKIIWQRERMNDLNPPKCSPGPAYEPPKYIYFSLHAVPMTLRPQGDVPVPRCGACCGWALDHGCFTSRNENRNESRNERRDRASEEQMG
jgi:hypothetical protein